MYCTRTRFLYAQQTSMPSLVPSVTPTVNFCPTKHGLPQVACAQGHHADVPSRQGESQFSHDTQGQLNRHACYIPVNLPPAHHPTPAAVLLPEAFEVAELLQVPGPLATLYRPLQPPQRRQAPSVNVHSIDLQHLQGIYSPQYCSICGVNS